MNLDQYLDEKFDDRAVVPSKGLNDPVPEGIYLMQMEKGEITYTKNGMGVLFKARFPIIEGEFAGSSVFAQYNVRNQNQQAQTIGIAEMKALTAACGLDWENVRSETDLLLYKPFHARVGMERESINKETGKAYPPRNKIMKYYMPGEVKETAEQTRKWAPPKESLPKHANPENMETDDPPF